MQKVFFLFYKKRHTFLNEATKQRSNIWIFDFSQKWCIRFYIIYYII